MLLYISHDFFHYEAGNLCRLFFPYEKLEVTTDIAKLQEDSFVVKAVLSGNKATVELTKDEEKYNKEIIGGENEDKELIITRAIFLCFSEFLGYKPKWGLLTGIHPVKLYSKYVRDVGVEEADFIFSNSFYVSEEKLSLLKEIAQVQEESLKKPRENDFSLYVSIPFCPTRCNYCSFVSQSIEKQKKLIEPYLEKLIEEIDYTAKVARDTGLRLITVYIGGGTPTTLSAQQLKRLIHGIKTSFDLSYCHEFTVEAGRPDTIEKDKLEVFKAEGIRRISINPQSLNDKVLEIIGRKHSALDIINSYSLAKDVGIEEINMDLIAGLEGDTLESFKNTLDKVIELEPENVTVHSLALKRSANIFHNEETKEYHDNINNTVSMIDYSINALKSAGYKPYYLYRQSRMAGNLENTGWAKPKTVCDYNVYTMDENHTVIACGAGGVSKIKDPYSDRLERIFNFKYSYEYLSRFDEMLSRKDGVKDFYEQFRKRIY